MSTKRKKTTSASTTQKLKSVAEWLLAAWSLPGSVPVPRLALANQDKGKTAVKQFHRPIRCNWSLPNSQPTYEFLPPGELMIVISPKITRVARVYNRNKGGSLVQYVGIQGANGTANLRVVNHWVDLDWMIPQGAQLEAYDNKHFVTRTKAGEASFYWDGNSASGGAGNSQLSYTNTVGASAQDVAQGATVYLMQWVDNHWVAVYAALFGLGATSVNMGIGESGHYGIFLNGFTPQTEAGSINIICKTNGAVMQTYTIEQLDTHTTVIDEYRVSGNAGRLTDIVAPLNAEGAVVGVELFGSEGWLDYLNQAQNNSGQSVYDLIADAKGAEEPQPLIRGKYGINKVRDRSMIRIFDNNIPNNITEHCLEPFDDEYCYVFAAFTQADSSGNALGADGLFTLNTDIEYVTQDLWSYTEAAKIDPVTVMQTQFKFNTFPSGGDNPGHWSKFLKIIAGATAVSAPLAAFIPLVGPGIAAGLGVASFASGTAGTLLAEKGY